MKLFCNHKWSLLSETVTKCKAELLVSIGCTNVKNLHDPVDRKFIQIVTCDKCGKLKRFVEGI